MAVVPVVAEALPVVLVAAAVPVMAVVRVVAAVVGPAVPANADGGDLQEFGCSSGPNHSAAKQRRLQTVCWLQLQ